MLFRSGNKAAVIEQMKKKHPTSHTTWNRHIPAEDGSDATTMGALPEIIAASDIDIGTGPRGFHQHYILSLCRARSDDINGRSPLKTFEKLGILVLQKSCSFVTLALSNLILTPLKKEASITNNDARPVSASDRDNAIWLQAAAKDQMPKVRSMVVPHSN